MKKITILAFLVVLSTAVFADTHSGNVSSNQTWSGTDTIVSTVIVLDGVTLTILPSSVIKFNSGTSLRVYGVLVADGTVSNPITFTANTSTPVEGFWGSIQFTNADPGCIMDNCLIRWGGNSNGNIRFHSSGSNVTIQDCDIKQSATSGIYISNYGAEPILTNNDISDNLSYGIYNNNGNPLIEDCEFHDNGDYMIYTYAYSVDNITGSLTYSGNVHNEIFVHGQNFGNHTWANHGVPYILGGAHFEVIDGDSLTIEAGCSLKFAGNYQFQVSGTLIADGTVSDKITFTSNQPTPAPGDWYQIYFVNADPGCLMDNCSVQYGGSSYASVYIYGDGENVTIQNSEISYSATSGVGVIANADPLIQNCIISNNQEYGISCHFGYSTPFISDCVLENNGNYAMNVWAPGVTLLTGNFTISGNSPNAVYVNTGSVSTCTWINPTVPYVIGGNITVTDGQALTIEPGNTLKFAGNYQFQVNGTLIADGSTDQITFTSNAATPSPGDWRRIYFVNPEPGCLMDNCLIQYGGSSTSNVYIYGDGSNVTIRNSEISYSGNTGIGVDNYADPIIQNCTISDNLDYGISCHFGYSTPFVSDCILENNGNYAMNVQAPGVDRITGNYTITGNNPDAIHVISGSVYTCTWINPTVPYAIGGNITVANGHTLTLEPGNTLKFTGNYRFEVNGTLIADGTASDKITFTSNQAIPAPGDWLYLYFNYPDDDCLLDYCDISYGGSSTGNIYLRGNTGSVDITNSTVSYSLHNGLHIQDYYTSSPVTDNCIFENNTEYGVWLQSASNQTFTGCIVQNNQDGVYCNDNSQTFLNHNKIINNTNNGFVLSGSSNIQFGSDLSQWNDIYGNGVMNFNNGSSYIDAQYIYWGTTDSTTIASKIYDYYNDPARGIVYFKPWTNAAHDSLFPDSFFFVDLKAYLEGPFNVSDMNTDLNTILPLTQPYNMAPWNYTGTESVASIPNANIVDWVLIELRDATSAGSATSATIIDRFAGFLLDNGRIVALDGSSDVLLSDNINNNLYVVIWHRNHLGIMSANALIYAGGTYTYDFTTPTGQAYGTGAQKNLGSVYGMYAADGNADGIVNDLDISVTWATDAGNSGYLDGDFDMDSQSNNIDKNDVWEQNIGEGSQLPIDCGDVLIDYRDGQSYNTVLIGGQCWMAENLNIGTMINGSSNQTDNSTIEKYCYDDNTSNCNTYGGLYQWDEMMQYVTTEGTQGICPYGWHLPTDAEWCTLENFVDAGTISCTSTDWRGIDAGGNLKETGTTHWSSPNTGATNSSGFTALPGGVRYPDGSFGALTVYANFWTSSVDGTSAWRRYLYYLYAQVRRNTNVTHAYGFSVRCIKD